MLYRTQSLLPGKSLSNVSEKPLCAGISGGLIILLGALAGACGSDDQVGSMIDAAPAADGPLADADPGGGGTDADPMGGDAMAADAAPSEATIYINEVVTHPRHDWGDSGGGGDPFDSIPGDGRISSSDQYIELFNAGTANADMRGWQIQMTDANTETAVLSASTPDLVISAGSSLGAVRPGAFVLIGNPPGTMGNDVYITLRDAAGALIDDVEIGGVERDAEGDGPDDGAPAPDQNGFARGAFDEAIARPVDAPDTNVDQLDFVKMPATPLAPNVPPAPPDETVAPDVVDVPSGNGFPVTELIRIAFTEAIDPASVEGNVTLSAGGQDIAIAMFTFEDSDKVLVLNTVGRLPFDTDIAITARGGAGGVADLAGNTLPVDASTAFRTEPAPANPAPVLLNELCISPLQDWNRSSGGEPFSDTPGNGDVSSSDEWVELYARQGGLDLSGYTLEVFNGPTLSDPTLERTPLHEATVKIFGTGTLTAVVAGDRIIIGNPSGSIEDNTFIALRDELGQLVDVVEVGGNIAEQDRGGDGIENGAPGAGLDGDSNTLADEVVARIGDSADTGGQDTGDDVADWEHAAATPGAPNN